MTYHIGIPSAVESNLEKVPLQVALGLERHLEYMAEVAELLPRWDARWSQLRDPDSGFLRFDLDGYSMFYDIDHRNYTVALVDLRRGPAKAGFAVSSPD